VNERRAPNASAAAIRARAFPDPDAQHVPGQHNRVLRPEHRRQPPSINFHDDRVIDRREPPLAGLRLAPQREQLFVAVTGQVPGREFVQDLVQTREQLRVVVLQATVEHAFILLRAFDHRNPFRLIS
jgi:hypothetical protein